MNTPLTLREWVRQAMVPCPRCNGTGRAHDITAVGSILVAYRKKVGLTQKAVAAALGISAGYLTDLEHGRRNWPTGMIEAYIKLLEAAK